MFAEKLSKVINIKSHLSTYWSSPLTVM